MKRDMYGHLIHVSDKGHGGFGVCLSFHGEDGDLTPYLTVFHDSDGFQQAMFSADVREKEHWPDGKWPEISNTFEDRTAEVLALVRDGGRPLITEYPWDPDLKERRLKCPLPLGGCGTLCWGKDPQPTAMAGLLYYPEWDCPKCGKLWNGNEADRAMRQLEEEAAATQPAVIQVVEALGALVLPLREWLESNADNAPTVERIEATTTALRAGLAALDRITGMEAHRARYAAKQEAAG